MQVLIFAAGAWLLLAFVVGVGLGKAIRRADVAEGRA